MRKKSKSLVNRRRRAVYKWAIDHMYTPGEARRLRSQGSTKLLDLYRELKADYKIYVQDLEPDKRPPPPYLPEIPISKQTAKKITSSFEGYDIKGRTIKILQGKTLYEAYMVERQIEGYINKIQTLLSPGEAKKAVKIFVSRVNRITKNKGTLYNIFEDLYIKLGLI